MARLPSKYARIEFVLRLRRTKMDMDKVSRVSQQEAKAKKSGLRRTVYFPNGDEYCGEWLDDKKHGKGIHIWKKNGLKYEGDWKHGLRDGIGILSKLNPISNQYIKLYSGGWKDGKKDGFGTYCYSKNASYEGHWSRDQRSGWGRMYYGNGDVYEGEWLEDKSHGQGTLLLSNGNRYEGSWKNGKKHGTGKFYMNNGHLYDGMWNEDIPKCGEIAEFGIGKASDPKTYHIPKLQVQEPKTVLLKAQQKLSEEHQVKQAGIIKPARRKPRQTGPSYRYDRGGRQTLLNMHRV